MRNIFKSQKFKYGSISTLVTIGFISIVVILNIIVSLIIQKFPLELDLTKNKIFKLTEPSINYVKDITEDVKVEVLAEEKAFKEANQYYSQASIVIDQYVKYNDKIKVSYVDLYKNPDIASKYSSLNVAYGDIVVSSGERTQSVTAYDLFNIEQSQQGSYITSSKAEQAMTGAIMHVLDKNPKKVSVLSGQSEEDISGLTDLLKRNSYDVITQNILTEQIDKNVDIVIISSPTKDYTDDQLKKVEDFLHNDGNLNKTLIYLSSQYQKSLPKLEEFLAEWGIKVENSIIFETDPKQIYISPFFSIQNIVDESLIKDSKDFSTIISPSSRPLSALFEASGNITTTQLLKSNFTSALRPLELPEGWTINDAQKGDYSTIILSTKTDSNLDNEKKSNILAIGSAEFFNSDLLSSTAIGNADYSLSVINNIVGKKENIKIVSKDVAGLQLGMSATEIIVLTIIFMFIIPIVVIIIGIVIWIRRRNL